MVLLSEHRISRTEKPVVEHVEERIRDLVEERVGAPACEFINKYAPNLLSEDLILADTSETFNITKQPGNDYRVIINLGKFNRIRRVSQFFIETSEKLPVGGLFIGRVETIAERKKRAYRKFPKPFAHVYYFGDFLFHRVMPKVGGLQRVYFFMTKGKRRVLSRAEMLGRLVSCGFDIVEEVEIENVLYFVGRKNRKGHHAVNPSYGPLFGMRRVGKGGKTITVYKMRTMHPYSEYLQEYIYKLNNLQSGGKFASDFRINTLGKFFRKFWIDEIPMIFNLLNGDMKLVGVRPLSSHYLSLYDESLKQKRLQTKPGLIPPYYADLPETLEEIQDSETRYLDSYAKAPFTTDVKYFFKVFYNILVKRARSK